MPSVLQISFHNSEPIDDVQTRVRQELAELEKFENRIMSCNVDIYLPEHPHRASVSKVQIGFGLPGSVETKTEPQHLEVKAQHKNAEMAVHGAFNKARRYLSDFKGR